MNGTIDYCHQCGGCGDDGYGNPSSCRECGGTGVLRDQPRMGFAEYTARMKRWERHQEELRDAAEQAAREREETRGGDAA